MMWAILGNWTRAENLARLVSSPYSQWRALVEVAGVAAADGDNEAVERALDGMTGDYRRGYLLLGAARAAAAAGRFRTALRWARIVQHPDLADEALGAVLRRGPAEGERDRRS